MKHPLDALALPPTRARPLQGVERDEIEAMVQRLKRADLLRQQPTVSVAPAVMQADLQWAADWELPADVFEYFTIERMA
jgi:hypothetical protein